MELLGALVSAFVQLGLFLVVPVAWWALTVRRRIEFATWIGLYVPKWRVRTGPLAAATLAWLVVSVSSVAVVQMIGEGVAASRFAGSGLLGVLPVLLYALIQTSLSEELFFRGFLGKRLIGKFGLQVGNAVQATVFGLVHVFVLAQVASPLQLAIIGVLTALNGWIMGWINEELAGGSILPSWMLHAAANLVVGLGAAFGLLA